MMEANKVKLDRMMYVKDKVPSYCALIAIVLNVFYFVSIYQINKEYFYNFNIGLSVITNLLFMLFAFLCSEEVKNYHSKYGFVMIGLAVLEIVRIFYFPMHAHAAMQVEGETMVRVMTDAHFMKCIVLLSGAAVFLTVGGIMSIINSKKLNDYKKSLEK